MTKKRVEKISLLIQEFNIEKIIRVRGKANCLPDYLSRNPISHDDDPIETDYDLGFKKDDSTSTIEMIGAVTTLIEMKTNDEKCGLNK